MNRNIMFFSFSYLLMSVSFLHEIVHAILNEGQYSGSSDDEPLVEWLAKCLKHLKDQKVI